jgi:tRNA threonylcarbamoyladenosine biosynthesis protein TsaB
LREPLLLALESATPHASVALLEGERLVVELANASDRPHSTRLLPLVDRVLDQAGVGLEEVGSFAVSIGPGSFTGLRIGLATLKGLTYASSVPAVAVPTLAALARNASGRELPVLACLDARRGELYAAVHGPGREAGAPLLVEGVYTPRELAERIPRPCRVVGCPGEEDVLALLCEQLGPDARLDPPLPPRALHVGRLGRELLAAGQGARAGELAPRYLRRAEAEVKRTGQRFEAETAV